jgi:H/ACA ribonucleoprotein complex subunit 4
MDIEKIKSEKSIQELLEFGIININKPSGPTSFTVSDFVRKTLKPLGVKKTSHFGTLDPKVTGVLPVALNRGCKLTGFFIGEDKEYVGIMRMHEDIHLEKIKEAIKEKFIGNIKQTPPKKSRVKRVEREREVKRFDLLEKDGNDVLFLAEVQGGTYIRKLIDDLGRELNLGAHMLELRRVRAGIFKEEGDKNIPKSVNLYDLEKVVEEFNKGNEKPLREIIIPGEIVSEVYEIVEIKDKNLKQIFTGKPIYKSDLKKKENFEDGKIVSVFCKGKFVEMARVVKDGDIFSKPEFVFQQVNN